MSIRSPHSLMLAAVLSTLALPVLAADDPVVAVVNGKEIRRSAVIEAQQSIPQARQAPLEQVFEPLLDRMITNEVIYDQAKKQKLDDDAQVKAAFKDAQTNIMVRAWVSKVAKKADGEIPEAQVKAKYDELAKAGQIPEEVKVAHILVDSEDAAKSVLSDLKSGISFSEEAKAKSKDPSAKTNGGDLDYVNQGSGLVPEFLEAALKLKAGETTQTPVKTQFGYHIIKADDRRTIPYEKVKDQVKGELVQNEIAKMVEGLRKTATVKRFKLDGSPADSAAKAPAK
jgi:peptidyl-prolyl cis-trans isomerase C